MKSTIYATREYFQRYGSRIVAFAMSAAIVTLVSFAFSGIASAQTYVPVTTSADLGSRGAHVTAIQTFLAGNAQFYPEGLITGYYGPLTAAAVRRFQVFYGIVSSGTPGTTGFGRVGPVTLARMNALIASGGLGTGTSGDLRAPSIFNVNRTSASNSLAFTFNTDEAATSRIAYGVSPVMFNEGNINGAGFGPISASVATGTLGMGTSHSITVPNLSANTNYYVTIIVTDASGNVSVWGPNNLVRTNP